MPTLAAEYLLKEGSGLVAHDTSGNGHDGAIIGGAHAPTWTPDGLHFDGSTGSDLLPDTTMANDNTSVTNFALEAWVNADVSSLGFVLTLAGSKVQLSVVGNTPFQAIYVSAGSGGAGGNTLLQSGFVVGTAGIWQHVVFVRSGTTSSSYLNGVPTSSSTLAAGSLFLANSPGSKALGADPITGGVSLVGTIGEVRLYTSALTATDALNQFNATKSRYPNPPPTIATFLNSACSIVGSYFESHYLPAQGVPPYSYSISVGSLPPGLVLGFVSAGGAAKITGTPTTPGTTAFTLQVTDHVGGIATLPLTYVIAGTTPLFRVTPIVGTLGSYGCSDVGPVLDLLFPPNGSIYVMLIDKVNQVPVPFESIDGGLTWSAQSAGPHMYEEILAQSTVPVRFAHSRMLTIAVGVFGDRLRVVYRQFTTCFIAIADFDTILRSWHSSVVSNLVGTGTFIDGSPPFPVNTASAQAQLGTAIPMPAVFKSNGDVVIGLWGMFPKLFQNGLGTYYPATFTVFLQASQSFLPRTNVVDSATQGLFATYGSTNDNLHPVLASVVDLPDGNTLLSARAVLVDSNNIAFDQLYLRRLAADYSFSDGQVQSVPALATNILGQLGTVNSPGQGVNQISSNGRLVKYFLGPTGVGSPSAIDVATVLDANPAITYGGRTRLQAPVSGLSAGFTTGFLAFQSGQCLFGLFPSSNAGVGTLVITRYHIKIGLNEVSWDPPTTILTIPSGFAFVSALGRLLPDGETYQIVAHAAQVNRWLNVVNATTDPTFTANKTLTYYVTGRVSSCGCKGAILNFSGVGIGAGLTQEVASGTGNYSV